MKTVFYAAAFGLVLSACGGGGGGVSFKDPNQASFTYGSATTPSSDEQTSADTAAGDVQQSLAFVSAGSDTASSQSQAIGLDAFNASTGIFPGDFNLPASRAAALGQAEVTRRASALVAGDLAAAATGWDDDSCWTLTATALTFNGCTKTISDTDVSGRATLNGTFHREAGHVFWDAAISLDVTLADPSGSVHLTASEHLRGDITFSTVDQTITGYSRVDVSAAASGNGQHDSAAVTFNADYDLGYTTTPSTCVDSGTLTLKRLWAQIPTSATDPSAYADASVRFTWSGCGVVTVERTW